MRCVTAIAVVLACACGGDDSPTDADGGAGGSVDAAACDVDGFAASDETAERDDELEVLFYTGSNAQSQRLAIDFYFSLGASDGPQSLELNGEGLDTCSTCVTVRSGCGSLTCETTFVAQSGTLSITAMGGVGESLQGSLSGAIFAEAEIGDGLETTLVPGGQRWCLSTEFDVAVTGP